MKYKALANSYLSALCMELAMMTQAGIALLDGVLMLYDDEADKDGKTVMRSLLDTLENGAPLSDALRESGYFPRYMVNMTEIGEKTGRLAETLKALSEHYDRQDRLSISIKNAVMYPALMLIMMVAVVFILITRVLPIFDSVFNSLGSQMSPLATRLMQFGGWLRDVSGAIAAIFGIIIVFAIAAWIVPAVRKGIVNILKNQWGSYGVFGNIASSRFASAMALAMASGLDAGEAIEMASAISGGTKAVDKKHKLCMELLQSGNTLSEAAYRSGILSARDSRMLSIGSRSGMADAAMAEIARRSDRNAQDEIDRIVGAIEPALVIIISVIVGIILLSVMLPLMGIMTSIG